MYDGAAPFHSSSDVATSPVMLTGVAVDSSARRNDVWLPAWLSVDAWRAGPSSVGVSDRLMGLEKLKDGRGRLDMSELMDAERPYGKPGEAMLLLPMDSFLMSWEWNEELQELVTSPSSESRGEDMTLEVRLGNKDRGGKRVL